jgi:hypothetical protein
VLARKICATMRTENQGKRRMRDVDYSAKYEILVDGKPRSMRDAKETAIEAGRFLKHKQPQSEISVRDVRDGSVVVIDGAKIVELDAARKR